jgi:hypothetical protein
MKYLYDALSGGVTSFDDSDRLTGVEHRDASNNLLDKTTYLYEDANLPLHVTGVLDANGTRRWIVVYDTEGRATESKGPGDFQKTTVSYGTVASPSFTRTVTNAVGKSGTFTFNFGSADVKVLSYSGAASTNCPSSNPTYAYNTSSFLSSIADEEGLLLTIRVTASASRPRSSTAMALRAPEPPTSPGIRRCMCLLRLCSRG